MNFEEILKTLKEYYANTLIVQYHGKPKASATIKKLIDLVYANLALLRTEYAFDWKTAVREQLDIIGQWVGVNRVFNIPEMANKVLLSYPESNKLVPNDITTSAQFGYANYPTDAYIVGTEFEVGWLSLTAGGTALTPKVGHFYKIKTEGEYLDKIYYWTVINEVRRYIEVPIGGVLRYSDLKGLDSQLGDKDFRQLIGMKIIYNNIPHTVGAIDKAIWEYFGARNLYYLPPFSLDTMLYADSKLKEEVGQVYKLNTLTIGQAKQGEWTTSSLGFDANDRKIEFINGKYFILANNRVYYSDNLENWIGSYIGSIGIVRKILYINNLYYAYDRRGNYYTSSNLRSWSKATKIRADITQLYNIIYGNGIYVATIGTSQLSGLVLTTSTDGLEWTQPFKLDASGSMLCFAKDRFYVNGAYSFNGTDWLAINNIKVDNGEEYRLSLSSGVTYGNGLYVSIGQVENYYSGAVRSCSAISTDGINWRFFFIDFDGRPMNIYDNNSIIFANNQFYVIDVYNSIYTSKDGQYWQKSYSYTSSSSPNINNLIYNDRKILGVLHGDDFGSLLLSSEVVYDETSFVSYPVALPQESTDTIQSMTVGNVYTTWDIPQTVTYHYPQKLSELMNICLYKNILPAPIGTEILLTEIQEN